MGLEQAEIRRDGDVWTAAVPGVGISVVAQGANGEMAVHPLFKRRAIRTNGGKSNWLVAEVDGVRTYVSQDPATGHVGILVTKDDVYPDPAHPAEQPGE